MMLFAIVFGLSMDYAVFPLTGVREGYDRDGESSAAVNNGLAATARIITAAGLIMVSASGSFLLEDLRTVKILGLAVVIAIDVTVIWMLLIPAATELFGDRVWWIPRWLDRMLPNLVVEPERSVSKESGPDHIELST